MCQGHELTLRVLYRLFGEAEEETDFFSSTTAASVYETFLLAVVCTLFVVLFLVCPFARQELSFWFTSNAGRSTKRFLSTFR